ncbi:MAG TPA: PTS mannitol transporter subunit IIBC, partial [Actinophytocola sp.]
FLGGIHEIYFPYLLMKPKLIIAAIAGGMAGVGTAMITHSGLVATPAPGSIFAYMAVTPRGGHVSVLLSIAMATAVAFIAAAALLKFGHEADAAEPVLDAAVDADELAESGSDTEPAPASVGTATSRTRPVPGGAVAAPARPVMSGRDVRLLTVACDAGMGSSAMLASQLRNRLKPYGVAVEYVPVNELAADATLVLTHADLADRARATAPQAVVVEFRMFLGDPAFDQLENAIKEGRDIRG